MMYAARTADGHLTGTTYPTLLPEAIAHHAQYGEVLIAVAGIEPTDDTFSTFVEVVPDLTEARAVALTRMRDWIAAFTARFTEGVPSAELASWPTKDAAARAHLAGSAQALVIEEARITGEDPDDLARRIIAKADLYTGIVARVTGLRRATEAAIAAADTPEAAFAALDAALATANQLIADLGLGPSD